jgi:hypothetical protein
MNYYILAFIIFIAGFVSGYLYNFFEDIQAAKREEKRMKKFSDFN